MKVTSGCPGYFTFGTKRVLCINQQYILHNASFVLQHLAYSVFVASSVAFTPDESVLMKNGCFSFSVSVIPTYKFHIEKCVFLWMLLLVVILWMGLGHYFQL
jgi:hypothetical protein